MCIECGCDQPVPFGLKVLRFVAPGVLRANTVPAASAATPSAGSESPSVRQTIDLQVPLLAKNDQAAAQNRRRFKAGKVLALNLVSSPGAGKTTLLSRTLDEFGVRTRCAVVVGDLETDHDARRLARPHAPVAQITTGTACHLDAAMVAKSVDSLDLAGVRVLFIENVGNLVCPAEFDLGEELRVVLLSTTEGEEKPLEVSANLQDRARRPPHQGRRGCGAWFRPRTRRGQCAAYRPAGEDHRGLGAQRRGSRRVV
jgi:hydrogenase nickel incorporation protein HypB